LRITRSARSTGASEVARPARSLAEQLVDLGRQRPWKVAWQLGEVARADEEVGRGSEPALFLERAKVGPDGHEDVEARRRRLAAFLVQVPHPRDEVLSGRALGSTLGAGRTGRSTIDR